MAKISAEAVAVAEEVEEGEEEEAEEGGRRRWGRRLRDRSR